MTDLTRRDALMLTAAIAATTSATVAEAQAPVNNNNLPDDNTLLTVPSGAVANSSIPISLKIPATTFAPAPDNTVPSKVQVVLTISDVSNPPTTHSVFNATLQDMALPPFNNNQASTPAIALMTRLKMGIDKNAANQSPQATIVATVTMTYASGSKQVKATQSVTIKNEDCATSDMSVLRLSLQPAATSPKTNVMVRAIVPPVPTTPPPSTPTHKLTNVSCMIDPAPDGTKPFLLLENVDDTYLSTEAFVGFSIFPSASQKINMAWTYVPNPAITGSTFSGYTLNASGLAVVNASSS
jgi:hypothetical protein